MTSWEGSGWVLALVRASPQPFLTILKASCIFHSQYSQLPPYKASLWQKLSSFLWVNVQPIFTECLLCAGLEEDWAHALLYAHINEILIARNTIIFPQILKPACIYAYNFHLPSWYNEKRALSSKVQSLFKCSGSYPHFSMTSLMESPLSPVCSVSLCLPPYWRWK